MARRIAVGNGRYSVELWMRSVGDVEVFSGTDAATGEPVEVHVEPARLSEKVKQVLYAGKVFRFLTKGVPMAIGFPVVLHLATENEYDVMVVAATGPSLESLFEFCGGQFSPKCVHMLGLQLLGRLEFLHERHFLMRDVEPASFAMGLGKRSHHVLLTHLGAAKRYRDPKTLTHVPFREGKLLTGNPIFQSVNAHLGVEQSRRDDLEALAYVLVYFAKGTLPWSDEADDTATNGSVAKGVSQQVAKVWRTGTGASPMTASRLSRIADLKMALTPDGLCRDSGCPSAAGYLTSVKMLAFDEQPAYGSYRAMLSEGMDSLRVTLDYQFDWLAPANQGSVDDAHASASHFASTHTEAGFHESLERVEAMGTPTGET